MNADGDALGKSFAASDDWRRRLGVSPKGIYISTKTPVDQQSRMVSLVQLTSYQLVIVVTSGMDDLLGPWRFQTRLLVAVALLISLVIVGMGYVLLNAMTSEMAAKGELERLMLTDPLTGVGNRRLLTRRLKEEVLRSERYGRALTVAFFDVDHFKAVNDRYGHQVGDIVLKEVARSLSSSMRQSDFICRFGGEEFVILLTETGVDDALVLVERMRQGVGDLAIPEYPQRFTVSAGIAQWNQGDSDEALLQRSDAALYHAKMAGRNRSVVEPVV